MWPCLAYNLREAQTFTAREIDRAQEIAQRGEECRTKYHESLGGDTPTEKWEIQELHLTLGKVKNNE